MIKQFEDKIYAGVLGKILGVYLGRPVEGWSYQKIQDTFDEVKYYVHDKAGVPLIVADDDISGTFGFFRAIEDNNYDRNLSAKAFGDTWLNYIIENRTILWWGGLGRSTEHTAFLNLKNGIDAPDSGSMKVNGKTLSEQIGAQIFIDAIAMACPNDPDLAVDLVRKAASVSHDGIAVQAACHLAALEAMEAGLPLVTSNIHGIRDYSLSGETGFACPVSNVEEFAHAIETLSENRNLRKRMGAYNQQAVEAFYQAKTDEIMKSVYTDVLKLDEILPETEPEPAKSASSSRT